MDRTVQEFGRLDGLINNVGMNIMTTVVDVDPSLWQKIIDTNLNGAFLCARKAGQLMREQKYGKIVNISSLAASRSAPAMGIYGIAKAGIEMMTKVLAQELALFNIQVNAVAPGMVRTEFSEPFWSNEDFYQLIVKTIPMGRIAEPEDVAHPVLFLCSDGAGFITGQTIGIDGGASAILNLEGWRGTEGDNRVGGWLTAISRQQHPSLQASSLPSIPGVKDSRARGELGFLGSLS